MRARSSLVKTVTTIRSDTNHFPGFDGLRLLAAFAVIFSHSYLIATGTEADEPFVRLLGPRNIIGLYGVFAFFSISGFLLARSLSRNLRIPRQTGQ